MAKNKHHVENSSGGTLNDADFLKYEIQSGVSLENPAYIKLFEDTLREVTAVYDFASFCDLGSGVGAFPQVVALSGREAVAYDANRHHYDYFRKHGSNEVAYRVQDFTKGIIGQFDLCACIEVAEHIPDEKLLPFLKTLHNHAGHFLFSSTSEKTEWDEGWGHINIKTQQEWISLFASFGWRLIANFNVPNHWTKLFKYEG
jgi:2-polyprenyl-3-methyl-5-hydroxy-6-metoxy-1,4-benzoquinol methylase